MNNQDQQQSPIIQPRISSLPGIGSLLKRAWKIYKAGIKVFLGIIFTPIFFTLFFLAFLKVLSEFSQISDFITFFLVIIFMIAMVAVIYWAQVALLYAIKEREQEIGIKESFIKARSKITSYLWISFLTNLIIFLGFLFFLIPGIIFMIWYAFPVYILISEDLKGTKALSRSKQLTKGNWLKVFWRMLAIFPIVFGIVFIFNILNIPRFGDIATVLISPFITIYYFLIYEDLKKIQN